MWALTTEDASRQLALSVNPLRMPGGGDPVEAERALIQAAFCA